MVLANIYHITQNEPYEGGAERWKITACMSIALSGKSGFRHVNYLKKEETNERKTLAAAL